MTATPPGPADYLAQVHRIAGRYARPLDAEADDLTQEAMARLVADWDGYDPARGRSRRTWALALSRHAFVDAFRRNDVGRAVVRVPRSAYAAGVRFPLTSLAEVAGYTALGNPVVIADTLPAREDRTPTREDAADMLRAAAGVLGRGLTRRERRLLELRFVYDFSVAECARKMRVSQTTLFSALLLFRAAAASWAAEGGVQS